MSAGFKQDDRDKLVRLETKLDTVCDFMKQAASPEGFPRCAARAERWDQVDEHIKKMDKIIFWTCTIIIGSLLTTGVAYAIGPIIKFLSDTPGM